MYGGGITENNKNDGSLEYPLSPFERDHEKAVRQLVDFVEKNHQLPKLEWVDKAVKRYEKSPDNFEKWHPNITKAIVDCPPVIPPSCDISTNPCVPIPPPDCNPPQPPAVPEPSSIIMMSIALVAFVVWKWVYIKK